MTCNLFGNLSKATLCFYEKPITYHQNAAIYPSNPMILFSKTHGLSIGYPNG